MNVMTEGLTHNDSPRHAMFLNPTIPVGVERVLQAMHLGASFAAEEDPTAGAAIQQEVLAFRWDVEHRKKTGDETPILVGSNLEKFVVRGLEAHEHPADDAHRSDEKWDASELEERRILDEAKDYLVGAVELHELPEEL